MTALLAFVSLLFFGADVQDMGSADYFIRERASRRAELLAPLNYLAIEIGTQSRDREIRWRCRRVMTAEKRRTEPFLLARDYVRATDLIYGRGNWYLSREQELAVLQGDYRFHHMMYMVAKRGRLTFRDNCECLAPCDVQAMQFANNLPVVGYRKDAMIGFANIMRRRLRKLPDYP